MFNPVEYSQKLNSLAIGFEKMINRPGKGCIQSYRYAGLELPQNQRFMTQLLCTENDLIRLRDKIKPITNNPFTNGIKNPTKEKKILDSLGRIEMVLEKFKKARKEPKNFDLKALQSIAIKVFDSSNRNFIIL